MTRSLSCHLRCRSEEEGNEGGITLHLWTSERQRLPAEKA